MKRCIFCLFKIFITTLSIFAALLGVALPSRASWPAFSVDDLITKSDLIVVANIVGEFNKYKYSLPTDQPVKWIVEVKYYIKGDIRKGFVFVNTPSRKSANTYNLDSWGKRVILFLRKDGNDYTPLSPAGVIPLKLTGTVNSGGDITGEEFLKSFSVSDMKLTREREAEITEFIRQSTLYATENSKPFDFRIWIINGIGAVIILAVLCIFEKKGLIRKKPPVNRMLL